VRWCLREGLTTDGHHVFGGGLAELDFSDGVVEGGMLGAGTATVGVGAE
jgi:hypothetical protein